MKRINNLIVELNSICNNNCIYCYIEDKSKTGKDSYTYLKNRIKYFRKNGVASIDFTGGEPTLSPNLIRLVKLAKRIGYDNINLITNGRRLAYEKYCQKLIDGGVNRIVISYDGPGREICEAITRSPGSFNETIKATKNIKARNIELGGTIVVNKMNYGHIKEMIAQLYTLKVDFINIQFLLPHTKFARRIPSSIIPKYKEVYPFITEALKELNKKIKINVHFIPYCYLRGFEKNLHEESLKYDRYVINFGRNDYNIGEHLERASLKTAKCKKCTYNERCMGFFFSYAKEFGIEKDIK